MEIIDTSFDGLKILKPKIYNDSRGYFFESFKSSFFLKNFDVSFIQDNESNSKLMVIRGLHYQKPPHAQSKLIRVISGEILDVVVDIRINSKTYGKSYKIILNDKNNLQLFIPKGFAHGFLVKSEMAKILYKVDNPYHPESEDGLMWNDKDLNIDWETEKNDFKISEKDQHFKQFKKLISPF